MQRLMKSVKKLIVVHCIKFKTGERMNLKKKKKDLA